MKREDFFKIDYGHRNPNLIILDVIKNYKKNISLNIAEIGIGSLSTTDCIINILDKKDNLYLFDKKEVFNNGRKDYLKSKNNICNIIMLESKGKDSYCDFLGEQVLKNNFFYDIVYLDGIHDFVNDCLAMFLLDKLIVKHGYLILHDFNYFTKQQRKFLETKNNKYLNKMNELKKVYSFPIDMVKKGYDIVFSKNKDWIIENIYEDKDYIQTCVLKKNGLTLTT